MSKNKKDIDFDTLMYLCRRGSESFHTLRDFLSEYDNRKPENREFILEFLDNHLESVRVILNSIHAIRQNY